MLKQYVVDAFTEQVFSGNPAAVCILERWLDDALLYRIARENAVHETAFVVPVSPQEYQMRWLTAQQEISLCGHATLAAAYVLMREVVPQAEQIRFQTISGTLTVTRNGSLLEMDLPAYPLKSIEVTDLMEQALGIRPIYACRGRDLLCVLEREEDVIQLNPNLALVKQLKGALLHVTAPGQDYDCVSRTFGPKGGQAEDQACGSGHCHIIPYWCAHTGKTQFVARQASPRGGILYCRSKGDRVILAGRAVLYSASELIMEGLS